MGKERGWVNVSVQTYQSHRNTTSGHSQRVFQQEYTVDESGATLNAVSRTSDVQDFMNEATSMSSQSSAVPTTSIFIRDWKVSGRRAFIRYDRGDSGFWFNPVVDERRSQSTPGFPCNRGDIFLKLGMRGARLIPWRLREGDVFRLGQAYVLVSKVRSTVHQDVDMRALSVFEEDPAAGAAGESNSEDEAGAGRSSDPHDTNAPQCYICYETGDAGNPLINPCQCASPNQCP